MRLAILLGLVLLVGVIPVAADIVFQDLGTSAPPSTLGAFTMLPFFLPPQEIIEDHFSPVWVVPGCPIPGNVTSSIPLKKLTIPDDGWDDWSHGYGGPIFTSMGALTATFTLPPGTGAFYFYLQPYPLGPYDVTVTANSTVSSGPIPVFGLDGANGFGFYATAGESIDTVSIVVSGVCDAFALAEFGISPADPIPTLSSAAWLALAGLLALTGWLVQRRLRG